MVCDWLKYKYNYLKNYKQYLLQIFRIYSYLHDLQKEHFILSKKLSPCPFQGQMGTGPVKPEMQLHSDWPKFKSNLLKNYTQYLLPILSVFHLHMIFKRNTLLLLKNCHHAHFRGKWVTGPEIWENGKFDPFHSISMFFVDVLGINMTGSMEKLQFLYSNNPLCSKIRPS